MPKVYDRCSILLYTEVDSKFYYCLGVDSKYKSLITFGGCKEDNEDHLDAAIRELFEESLGVIDLTELKNTILLDHKVVKDNNYMFPCKVNVSGMDIIVNIFRDIYKVSVLSEMSDIIWVEKDHLIKLLINNKNIFHPATRTTLIIYFNIYSDIDKLYKDKSDTNKSPTKKDESVKPPKPSPAPTISSRKQSIKSPVDSEESDSEESIEVEEIRETIKKSVRIEESAKIDDEQLQDNLIKNSKSRATVKESLNTIKENTEPVKNKIKIGNITRKKK